MTNFMSFLKTLFYGAVVIIAVIAFLEFVQNNKRPGNGNNGHPGLEQLEGIQPIEISSEEQEILNWFKDNECKIEEIKADGKTILYFISWTTILDEMPEVITPEFSVSLENNKIIATWTKAWNPFLDTYEDLKNIKNLRRSTL